MTTPTMDSDRLLNTLSLIAQAVSSAMDLGQVLKLIAVEAVNLVPSDASSIMLLDETHHTLLFSESQGLSEHELAAIRFKPGEGIAGWVVQNGQPVVVGDASADPRFAVKENDAPIASLLCVPLKAGDRIIGVLNVHTKERKQAFGEQDKELLLLLGHHVAANIEKHRLYELSITDELTRCYNHRYFVQELDKEIRRASRYNDALAIGMLDVDHFKRVNDTHGHPAGDAVLRQLALVTQGCIRDVDLLARYGGEEFAIILPRTGRQGAQDIAERVCNVIDDHRFLLPSGDQLHVTVSIGLAATRGGPPTAQQLVARADQALYQAKRQGRNQVVFV